MTDTIPEQIVVPAPAAPIAKTDWIQTFTDKKFYPLEPALNEYCIEDIAHALSNICRFAGHSKQFYSVAQHSVLVSLYVRPEMRLLALLHDAAEAYLGDVVCPIKSRLQAYCETANDPIHYGSATSVFTIMEQVGFKSIKVLEHQHMERIYQTLIGSKDDVFTGFPEDIKLADNMLLMTEARDLLGPPPQKWSWSAPMLREKIVPDTPKDAEFEFLKHYKMYKGS